MSALARQQTIRELVTIYERETARVRVAYATLDSVQENLSKAFATRQDQSVYVGRRHHWRDWGNVEDDLKEVAAQAWSRLVDRLEVRQFLSVKAAAELQRQIDKHEMPGLTYENVMGLLATFEQNAEQFARDAVREVFDYLRVRGSALKTNTEFELKQRVILPWMVEFWHHCGSYRVEYAAQQKLRALENVFQLMDGKPSRNRDHYSQIQQAIEGSGASGRGSIDYFEFKCFANKNLHLKFLRPELVERLNRVAGGMTLKPVNT